MVYTKKKERKQKFSLVLDVALVDRGPLSRDGSLRLKVRKVRADKTGFGRDVAMIAVLVLFSY